ncbi:MAG TPA: isoprenylcysteine carboxylmethyltransferase family protein [Ktedonobacterales bacterium]|jgi:protein-S-isoprenylcysteine O-methyltransferase Ste14|nr:isoprenylcysteine carboxylmethyltransferase family protein [Ktedonobacterales bacterium]
MRSNASQSSIDHSATTPQGLDSPGVRIPPPLIYALAFLIGWALQARFPLPFLSSPLALGLGVALMAAGGLLIIWSLLTLVRGHGTLNTNGASAALVAAGPYRISRNPMYLGLVLLYGGLACAFSVVWALLLLIPLIVYTQLGVIAREERYLDRAFGEAYRAYQARVRRWL